MDIPQSRLVPSFHNIDFSDIQLPMVCIFKHPKDFPNHYVARIYGVVDGVPVPTDTAMISIELQGIYDGMPFGSGRFTQNFPRSRNDHPTVIETWI